MMKKGLIYLLMLAIMSIIFTGCPIATGEVKIETTEVTLDKIDIKLKEGECCTLTATVEPENASNKDVVWNSSDDSIATVSNGNVVAVSSGMATITASTKDGKECTCTVKVYSETELNGQTYELEWSDEFDTESHIDDNWGALEEDHGESKAGNGYHIFSSRANASVKDGILSLKANVDKDEKKCIGATLDSKKIFLLKNTMWEMRFKAPKSTGGDWFVFLLEPKNYSGKYQIQDNVIFEEITPMELQGRYSKYRSACLISDNDEGDIMDTNCDVDVTDDFFDQWHTLKFVWEEENYYCYMDDVLVYTVVKNDTLRSIPENDLFGAIYLGADMMGEWSGIIDTDMKDVSYEIDYIKVWKKQAVTEIQTQNLELNDNISFEFENIDHTYQAEINVSDRLVVENVIPGSTIRLNWQGTSDIDIKEVTCRIVDRSPVCSWWKQLSKDSVVVAKNIKKGEPFSFETDIPISVYAPANVSVVLNYTTSSGEKAEITAR